MDQESLEQEQTRRLREQINLREVAEDVSPLPSAADSDLSSSRPPPAAQVSQPATFASEQNLLQSLTSAPDPPREHHPPALRSKWAGQAQDGSSSDHKQEQTSNQHPKWRNWHIALLAVVACLLSIFAAAKDYPAESLKVLGDWSVDNGNARLAAQFYNIGFHGDPRYQLFLINWSEKLRRERNYDDSAYLLTEAIKLTPTKSSLYLQRGNDNFLRTQTSEAMADYNKAIELDPTSAAAYNNRGCIFLHDRQWQAAYTSLSKAVELGPKRSIYWLNLGDCYFLQADYHKAILQYEEAILLGDERAWYESELCEDMGARHTDSFEQKINNEMRRQRWQIPKSQYERGIIDTDVSN